MEVLVRIADDVNAVSIVDEICALAPELTSFLQREACTAVARIGIASE